MLEGKVQFRFPAQTVSGGSQLEIFQKMGNYRWEYIWFFDEKRNKEKTKVHFKLALWGIFYHRA